MTEYKKQTNEIHEVSLESEISIAEWGSKMASIGSLVKLEVWTHFVGNGSDIEIKIEDKEGSIIEEINGKVYGDYYANAIIIPENAKEELTFTAKLPDHSLELKSDILKIINVTNLKWGQEEARRGDAVKLSADIYGVPDNAEVKICIYEYDQDGAHDFIAKFPAMVKSKKIETEWEFEYHEDTDEIPTEEEMQKYGKSYNPPEYFFVVDVNGGRFGIGQESGLLMFKDWLEIDAKDDKEISLENEDYEIELPDGTKVSGKTDSEGNIKLENIPPGKFTITFPGLL